MSTGGSELRAFLLCHPGTSGVFHRGTHPIIRLHPHDLITAQRPHLLMPWHWGWVFNIRILGTQTFRHSPGRVEVLYTWVTVILSLGKPSLPPQPHPYLPSWKPLLPWHRKSGLVRGLCWISIACSVLSEEQADVAWEWLVVALMTGREHRPCSGTVFFCLFQTHSPSSGGAPRQVHNIQVCSEHLPPWVGGMFTYLIPQQVHRLIRVHSVAFSFVSLVPSKEL